jgi:hypothetical protein
MVHSNLCLVELEEGCAVMMGMVGAVGTISGCQREGCVGRCEDGDEEEGHGKVRKR